MITMGTVRLRSTSLVFLKRGRTMKKINLSIAVVLLLCTAFSPKGDAFDAQDALWIKKQPSTAELPFDPLGPDNVRAFEGNRDVDEETRSFGRYILDMSLYLPNICVMATPIKYEGTDINSMRLDFGDASVKDDIALNSEVTLNDLDIALYYGIPFVKTVSHDRLNVDLGINLRSVDFDDDIEQDSIGQASESFPPCSSIPWIFCPSKRKVEESLLTAKSLMDLSVGFAGRPMDRFMRPVVTGSAGMKSKMTAWSSTPRLAVHSSKPVCHSDLTPHPRLTQDNGSGHNLRAPALVYLTRK
jgi:hypothetical protein